LPDVARRLLFAAVLNDIKQTYDTDPDLDRLLLADFFVWLKQADEAQKR
jgi:hypothetical protein